MSPGANKSVLGDESEKPRSPGNLLRASLEEGRFCAHAGEADREMWTAACTAESMRPMKQGSSVDTEICKLSPERTLGAYI